MTTDTVDTPLPEPFAGKPPRNRSYKRLFYRFVIYTMICSVVPLLAVGWAINYNYARLAEVRVQDVFRTRVENHRRTIQLFLQERLAEVQLVAGSHTLEQLSTGDRLFQALGMMNADVHSFFDLGVIDNQGRHLRYVGPYDLMDKRYDQTFWFKEVMRTGVCITDMFMGFRREPHFVIAVTRMEEGRTWILRATVDTDVFRSLVENIRVGRTGEVFLVNREGVLQTTPRFGGRIMEPAGLALSSPFDGVEVAIQPAGRDRLGRPTPGRIVGRAWLNNPHWMLVVQQDYAEAFQEARSAGKITLVFLHLAAAAILLATILITRLMIEKVRRRDQEAEQLNQQLMQTGKLAALGELSAGVAHEINNPLAIVLTERQLLLDAAEHASLVGEFKSQFDDSMNQIDIQVQRCKRITQNLLRFARRTESVIELLDLNAFLQEIVELVEREARTGGIRVEAFLEEGLPKIETDASQLQQVFLNLVTNAIDAHAGKPYGSVRISTAAHGGEGVIVRVEDTGCGIPRDHLHRIFDPFFTTKPVGRGTGLGLAICFSIIRRLGGWISVESEIDRGTQFTLFLPFAAPADGAEGGTNRKETP